MTVEKKKIMKVLIYNYREKEIEIRKCMITRILWIRIQHNKTLMLCKSSWHCSYDLLFIWEESAHLFLVSLHIVHTIYFTFIHLSQTKGRRHLLQVQQNLNSLFTNLFRSFHLCIHVGSAVAILWVQDKYFKIYNKYFKILINIPTKIYLNFLYTLILAKR